MSIDTNQIQKVVALKGTDPLLLGDSAGGTALLPITDLAKFLAEQDNAVKAALDFKADISAQQTVEATAPSSRTVTVKAEELPAYIVSLPRLLNENLTINVSGALEEELYISGFYGRGSLNISGINNCKIQNVYITNCNTKIIIRNISLGLINNTSLPNGREGIIQGDFFQSVMISTCSITGNGNIRGFNLSQCRINIHNTSIKNCSTAILLGYFSIVSVYASNDDMFENNGTGIYVYMGGGLVSLGGKTPATLGGTHNSMENGSLIVRTATTL